MTGVQVRASELDELEVRVLSVAMHSGANRKTKGLLRRLATTLRNVSIALEDDPECGGTIDAIAECEWHLVADTLGGR